jgi:hypothetical protein
LLIFISCLALASLPSSPQGPTELSVTVTPSSAIVYVDGVRRGVASHLHALRLTPGSHLIRVVNHKDEHQESVAVLRGKRTKWTWDFEDDRKTDTLAPAPSRREPKQQTSDGESRAEQAKAERPAIDPVWLKSSAAEPAPADAQESGVRRRAAQDLLAAMPALSAAVPVEVPKAAAPARHARKTKHAVARAD